jgi:hypothetical protein
VSSPATGGCGCRAFDLEGFRTWLTSESFPPNVRASFVGGELFVEMSPEAIESHNKVKTA